MNYRDIIRTANTNLRKSKLRTFLTISAVFMGALTLMLTTGIGAGLKTYVDEQVGSVGAKDVLFVTPVVENQNPFGGKVQEYDPDQKTDSSSGFSQALLQQSDIETIRKEPGIKEVVPLYPTSPDYMTAGDKKYVATLGQTVEGLIQPIRTGRMVRVDAAEYEVTIPSEFVEPLGFKNDQEAIGKKITFGFTDVVGVKFTQEATLVGVQQKALVNANVSTGSDSLIKAIFERNRQILTPEQRERYPNAFARFDANMTTEELKALQQRLKDKKYDAKTLDDQLGVIKTVINGIITFLNIFAAIALAAASFGIVNTLLMAVQERTREIGLMKALGMGRRKIFLLFSLEAVLIGLWGALIALGVANIIGRIGSSVASKTIFKDFEGLRLFSFPALSMIPIILLIMGIAFLAATLPARRASRLDPIEALRYE